jgi:hypothetical protein
MHMSGQLHAPVALPPGRSSLYLTNKRLDGLKWCQVGNFEFNEHAVGRDGV